MIKIIPNKKNISAEIKNCDLKELTNIELKKIKSSLIRYGMIFFKNQNLSSKDYITFAKKIGKPAKYPWIFCRFSYFLCKGYVIFG